MAHRGNKMIVNLFGMNPGGLAADVSSGHLTENQKLAIEKVEALIRKSNEIFKISMRIPHVRFDLKGTTGGYAHYQEWAIRLNVQALEDFREEMIENTIPHEVAHLVAFELYGAGIAPHGWEWQRIARILGCDASRCHSMPLEKAKKTRKFLYVCMCQKHQVGLNVHRKIQAGQYRVCDTCHDSIHADNFVREL